MYNKNYCSTAQNSSFWKRFLVRLLCKRKLVEKWVWQQLCYFSRWKINLQQRRSASHLSPKTVVKPLIQKLLGSLFISLLTWTEAGSQEFTPVRLRVSVCLTEHRKKENPFCTTGRSAGNEARRRLECKRSKARMRPKPSTSPACRGGGGKDNMEAAASQKPQPS